MDQNIVFLKDKTLNEVWTKISKSIVWKLIPAYSKLFNDDVDMIKSWNPVLWNYSSLFKAFFYDDPVVIK